MQETMGRIFRVLLVGVPLAILAHTCAGCDGGEWAGDADAGVDAGREDAGRSGDLGGGTVRCEIPSPTGDAPGLYGVTARELPADHYILVTTDARAACEAQKRPDSCYDYASGTFYPCPSQRADCGDPAHDFAGTTGKAWSVTATSRTGSCQAGANSGTGCVVTGLAEMPVLAARSWALCTAAGVFVGWLHASS